MADLLVVDDDPDAGEMLAMVLRDEGHQTRVAHDGCEGTVLIRQRVPDLLILDIEMPVLDGPGMAYALFLHDVGEDQIPILLVSGVVDLPAVAERVGTPYYLEKPFTFQDLLATTERALEERRPPAPAT